MTTFTETFNKADSPVIGPDLTWVKFSDTNGDPVGGGPDDGEVSSNSFGASGGDRTGLDPDAQEVTCFIRAEHDTGSTSMFTQAEVAALDVSGTNYPYLLLRCSMDHFAGPIDGATNDYYYGPTGLWAAVEPSFNTPDGCGISVYFYDQPSHTASYLEWDTAPGGGSGAFYALGPVIAPGDVIRIEHDAVALYVEVSINGTVWWAATYAPADNPIAVLGERGGLGIEGFSEPNPYPADADRWDNFSTGTATLEAPAVPTNQLLARWYDDGDWPDGSSTALEPLEVSFDDPLLELGGWTVKLRADDPLATTIAPEDIIVISVVGSDGIPVDAVVGIVDDDHLIAIDKEEEQKQSGTFSGPIILGLFKDGVIEPPNGVNSLPIVDDVHYDWTHPEYDTSGGDWTDATEITSVWYAQRDGSGNLVGLDPDHAGGRWAYLQWWTETFPPGNETAPDIRESTKIIGPSSGTIDGVGVPPGDMFLNEHFSTWFEGEHLYFLGADNSAVLFIDGAEIASCGFTGDTRTSGYEQPVTQGKVHLTAGEHTVAIKLTNGPIPFVGVPNPTGVAASIYVPSYPVLPDDLIWETTGSMRILEYPAETPGMSPCQATRIWLESHQANGRFSGWSLSCDDENDTANDAWAVIPVISMRVGQDDGLALLLKIMEGYADVRIPPDDQVIDMYNKDTFQPASGFTAQPAGNLTRLEFHRQRLAADELLIRSQFGWTRAGSAGGRRQGSMTFGPENAFDEVTRWALKELSVSSNPRDETQFDYKPLNDSEIPYVNTAFVPGSLGTIPTRAGGTTSDRCMSVGMAWEKDEELVVKVRFKDLVLQAQERILRQIKALGG